MTMSDRDGYIWYNGGLVEWREASVHVLAHTLHYGMGVFEGLRAYRTHRGPAIFRLEDHVRRLCNSAKITMMSLNYTVEQISQAHADVVQANKLQACYLRPMAFYGASKLGVMPDERDVQLIVAAWEWGTYLGENALEQGIRAKISSFCRQHPNTSMSKAKVNGNYLNSIYAKKEAIRQGYDEALMLDLQGYVAEGTGENIFLVIKNRLHTPTLVSALEGITRDTVIQLARDMGLEVIERAITRDELYIADEVFLTGTAVEITPVSEIDNVKIGNSRRGPITEQLQQAYFELVRGLNSKYTNWLTYVT
ncbi:MAG: branched-chain amino acid transaminase [Neisseriaceae bacterium]